VPVAKYTNAELAEFARSTQRVFDADSALADTSTRALHLRFSIDVHRLMPRMEANWLAAPPEEDLLPRMGGQAADQLRVVFTRMFGQRPGTAAAP
jgi:hypothetical protein